jgi:hypothetical protein
MFGLPKIPWGMLGIADGTGTRPDNSQEDMNSLQKLYASIRAANHTPNGRVARGFDQFGPQASAPAAPMLPAPPAPAPVDMGPPALSAAAMAPQGPPAPAPAPAVPMPQARPPEAPQAPEPMSMFQRNALMMRDPSSGAFIDPVGADRAQQASGPDVINKLLDMFHKKDNA